MLYRTNPKNGVAHSLLGFGAMRLPGSQTDPTGINVDEAVALLRHGMDKGINYIDTAYTYNEGGSEQVVAKALQGGYGDKVMVATKLPTMRLLKAEEHMQYLDESRKRLDRDYIDYYLLHGLKERYWPTVKKLDTIDFLVKMKAEGKIKNMGFAFHGETVDFLKEIVEAGPWDFVQIQYNYLDTHFQAGTEGLRYLGEQGLAVIVMEPLRGGALANMIPDNIQQRFASLETQRSPAEWGMRWVADHPEVTTILSGMNTMAQIDENCAVLSDAKPGSLTEKELADIESIAEEYRKLILHPCTSCGYCRNGCPQKIEIPLIINLRNDAAMFGDFGNLRFQINHIIRTPPSTCIDCKKCEEVCPQHLLVSEILKECSQYEDESLQYWRDYVED